MENLDDAMHVRHYQGHWYKNGNLLGSVKEKDDPLPATLINTVRSSIMRPKRKDNWWDVFDPAWKSKKWPEDPTAIEKMNSSGLEWIKI